MLPYSSQLMRNFWQTCRIRCLFAQNNNIGAANPSVVMTRGHISPTADPQLIVILSVQFSRRQHPTVCVRTVMFRKDYTRYEICLKEDYVAGSMMKGTNYVTPHILLVL